MKRSTLLAVLGLTILLVLAVVGAVQVSAATPVTGAIWTTDVGSTVNQNNYDSKEDVYLNGGPLGGGGGLPDGDYYWQVTTPSGVFLGSSGDTTFTVAGGEFNSSFNLWTFNPDDSHFADSPNGEYKVWISQNPEFPPSESKTDNFRVRSEGGGGVESLGTIAGMKFYDLNTDGIFDPPSEVPIPGWRIELWDTGGSLIDLQYTDIAGGFFFDALDPGAYTVTEVLAGADWLNTTTLSVEITVGEGEDVTGVDFGNVCLGAGGGKTLGFWSNKNGQAQINDGGTSAPELALLSSLNLVKVDGSAFNPTSYAQLKTWLLNGTSVNMSYMLSVQLAAMELNVEAGLVGPSALVYAPGAVGADSAGFISISSLMSEANVELGVHPTAMSGDSWRGYQEALKNALDAANNNGNFVHSGPCAFTTPY